MKKVLSVLLVLMMLMGTLLISPLSVSAADGWNGTTAPNRPVTAPRKAPTSFPRQKTCSGCPGTSKKPTG